MFDNKNFYPTPDQIIDRMLGKVQKWPSKVLEPSAGKGDIIARILEKSGRYSKIDIAAIEIDPELQATLRGKSIKILDTDFLEFSGPDQFDLIIANPPFDEGDKHLHKALDILYRGEIVFLLNAETLRNPCTNSRKLLLKRLQDANASIEYISNAFSDAERKTDVEVALIHVMIERDISDELFAGTDGARYQENVTIEEKHEVSTGRTIEELVAEYNETIRIGTETILGFYRNHRKISRFLSMEAANPDKYAKPSDKDLTKLVQHHVNKLLADARTAYWRSTLNLKEIQSRMTRKKFCEFEAGMDERCQMDFTENNIRQFIINLIGSYEQTLTEAVLDVFDMLTVRHCYHGGPREENIHYFNGWKTNNAFKVGKKVVVPGERYANSFFRYGKWDTDFDTTRMLDDIDKVMNYFDGGNEYVSINRALDAAFGANPRAYRQTGIESTYFRATVHKKGTIHLTFRNEDVLRRFNVVACRGKGWLPGDFGTKDYQEMNQEERIVVDSFEGEKEYGKHVRKPLFAIKGSSMGIEYKDAA